MCDMMNTDLKQVIMYNIFPESMHMESEDANESQEVLEGRWLKDQHERFLAGIIEHGKDWKIVEKVVKTRNGSQVRSHAQKFFIKLSKINKERKKCKNYNLIQPSDIQREILDHFREQSITANTPAEISAVIRKDWTAVATNFKQKKRNPKPSKAGQAKNEKQEGGNESEKKVEEEGSQNARDFNAENQEQSYFIRVIKSKLDHFKGGHDFSELIDFGHLVLNSNEESQTNPIKLAEVRERKQSFCLPDDEENESKLKQRLENLHRKMQSTG